MTGDSDKSIEEDPLLPSTRNPSEGENEVIQETDDDDTKTRKGSFWRRLDMTPTQRDRISFGLVLVSEVGSWGGCRSGKECIRNQGEARRRGEATDEPISILRAGRR
jgi:hypothetical protein